MKCPVCNVDLLMGERLTVSIDYCPQCRGIWLEKGKLDQIISVAGSGSPQPISSGPGVVQGKYPDVHHEHDHHGDHDYYEKKHKKKSFLDELF